MKEKYFCLNCQKELNQGSSSTHKFCNNKCQADYYHAQWIKRWKDGKETGIRGYYGISVHIKKFILEKYDKKCALCGWNKINPYTNTLPLEIDHIDGDYKNNKEENLILLCPNCHSLTSTYKGANKGKGRKNRKKYTK